MPPNTTPPPEPVPEQPAPKGTSPLEIMKRPLVLVLVGLGALVIIIGAALAFFTPLSDMKRKEPLHVGILQNVKHLDQIVDGFKQGLTEAGYEEGVDIVYDYQNADGSSTKAESITREFLTRNVDLILAVTSPAVEAAWKAMEEEGKSVPIVFTNGLGLVESGFLASYESSGKNVTGVVPDDIEVTVKKLEFLKAINPDAKNFGVFFGSPPPSGATAGTLNALREQAPKLGLRIVEYPVTVPAAQSTAEITRIAQTIKPGDIDAIITIPDVVSNFQNNPKVLIELGKRVKAPVSFLTAPRVIEGGLLAYSQDYIVFGKQAAAMADKIFKGVRPEDIPIETSKKNLLIINLKTAKEMGLTIPESLLFVADQVIPAETP